VLSLKAKVRKKHLFLILDVPEKSALKLMRNSKDKNMPSDLITLTLKIETVGSSETSEASSNKRTKTLH
jgi:hypothetical protein